MSLEQIQAYRCSCHCGHIWIAERGPKRCAKCKSRKWNTKKPSEPERPEESEDPFPEVDQPKVLGSKPPRNSKQCPECFSLNGGHQKKCSKNK